ncbi:MAG: Na/Pi cotransporter family protein, partial [bacterium]
NSGLLTLIQAISVVMGANIGTTVTTWIVSFLGFKFDISSIALPVVGLGLPLIFSKRRKYRDVGEILIGFGLLFIGLMFLKNSVPDIKDHPETLEFLKRYTDLGFMSYVIFVVVGSILTIVVQSSSAAMAITVTMVYLGWIDYYTAAAIVLGENIGTTVTAYLASLGTNVNARRAARAHFLFNLFGVLWISMIFRHFADFILQIAPWNSALKANFPLNLALFHTIFNIANTLIFLPFTKKFAKLVEYLVKPKQRDIDVEYTLKYISTGLQDTADFNLLEARREIDRMAQITLEMFTIFMDVYNHPTAKMGDQVLKVRKYEDLTDRMQLEISKYLVDCSQDELSEANMRNISALIRIVNELENIADSFFKLILVVERRYDERLKFHKDADSEVNEYSKLILEYVDFYRTHLDGSLTQEELKYAYDLECRIDRNRDDLRALTEKRMKEGSDPHAELLYLDLLKNFEHIGDASLNIAQALGKIED